MAIRVVLDHPRRVTGPAIIRRLLHLAGLALAILALVGACFAFPATVMLAVYHGALLMRENILTSPSSGISSGVSDAVLVRLPHWMDRVAGGPAGAGPSWFLHADLSAVAVAVAGRLAGPPLLRMRLRQALFLRRFGYDQATAAVTFATRMIGNTWRLVTLDDASVAPLGPTRSVRAAAAPRRVVRTSLNLAGGLGGLSIFVLFVMLAVLPAVLGKASASKPMSELWVPLGWPTSRADLFMQVMELVIGVIAISMAVGCVAMAWPVLRVAVLPISIVSDRLHLSMAAAERGKTSRILSAGEIEPTACAIARQSRRFISPRLVVLKVETEIWRPTVDRFAAGSAALLIDVSQPSESLLWEVEQVGQAYLSRCVFIGHQQRLLLMPGVLEVVALDGSVSRVQSRVEQADPIRTRLAARLDGHVVLAYTTDRRGVRRFGRALRARLEYVG